MITGNILIISSLKSFHMALFPTPQDLRGPRGNNLRHWRQPLYFPPRFHTPIPLKPTFSLLTYFSVSLYSVFPYLKSLEFCAAKMENPIEMLLNCRKRHCGSVNKI